MRRLLILLMFPAAAAIGADLPAREAKRVQEAAAVLTAIHAVPDRDIPQDLWARAACIGVVPGLQKTAFVVGGEYGKGLMSCRRGGQWSAPVFIELGKGSLGLQLGAESIDLVLLIMNRDG